jgi:hypothetical protein
VVKVSKGKIMNFSNQLSDSLKSQIHELIDYFLNEGIGFEMRHTYGYNMYDEERDDQIEINAFKRHFYIGIIAPKFYMVHSYLGKGNRLQEDKLEFKSFDEMVKSIKESDYDR